jgi:hypothetical protein
MDEHRKSAYRYLLYWAMLDIRGIQWIAYRPLRLLNPFLLRRELRRASRVGAVADWLHNLAAYAADDFEGFKEDWFWREHEHLVKRHGDCWSYRKTFDRRLEELTHSVS